MSVCDGVEIVYGICYVYGIEGVIGEGVSYENGDGGIDVDATAYRDASASAADRWKSCEGLCGWVV